LARSPQIVADTQDGWIEMIAALGPERSFTRKSKYYELANTAGERDQKKTIVLCAPEYF
jgi:hypothetical protein